MRKKVTIQEIADLVGVSKFAVSRALSSKPGVSQKTRETILKAAGQLGYFKQPDAPASSKPPLQPEWRDPQSGTIVVLFPNIRYQNRESSYWGPVFDGITNRLNRIGLDVLTVTEPSGDNLFSLLNPEAITGIITIGTISTPILLNIGRLDIPAVMVDHADPAFQCDTIFTDNASGMREMMARLISKGYRSYQFVGYIRDAPSFQERWLAFKSSLEEHGFPLNQDPLLIGPEASDIYILMQLASVAKLPEVYVCANDANAAFMVHELRRRGLQVPEHCAVTCFDNTNEDEPILATVDINKSWLGERAVDQLLWRLANRGKPFERKLIAGELIMRDQHARKPL